MLTKIKTQSFGLIDILAEGWNLYTTQFVKILIIVVCVYTPVNILLELIPADGLVNTFGQDMAVQVYQNIAQVLELFIGGIATLAVAWMIEGLLHGEELTWTQALRHGLSRWASMVGTGLLAGVILFFLFLALIIPGIIWSAYYVFWLFVVALRNVGGKDALDYSKSLVKGQWWRVFGISLVLGILNLVIAFVVGLLLNTLPYDPIVNVLSGLVIDVIAFLFVVMNIVWFLNVDYLRHPQPDAPAPQPVMELWQKENL
jgi:uncharacterized membrane protein